MQKEDLIDLITAIRSQKCETQTLEVKSAHSGCPTRLFDTLSAFSNQDDGGIILFGLDESEKFALKGVYDAQDLQHCVAEQCKQMQPIVRPLFTVCDIEGKIVVSAEIPGADITDRPVYYKGTGRSKGSFVRVGAADEHMNDTEIYNYDSYRKRLRDDIRIAEFASISQFDDVAISRYLAAVKENKPNIAKLSDDEILELTGVIREGKPTLAGVLCFMKYPQAAYPQLCITAVVVAGTQMGETGVDGERFSDNKRIDGTISQMLDEAMQFIKRNLRMKTIIDEDGKRRDKAEYPLKAAREAVLNALMHRDYSIQTESVPVQIIIFNDRMEIANEGGLFGRLTPDSLGKVHPDTRNQALANILETLKIAENRYSGIATIRMAMKEHKLPEPVFENKRGSFVVTFKNDTVRTDVSSLKEDSSDYMTLMQYCKTPRSRKEIADFIGQTQYYTMKITVMPLIKAGKLSMTIPDKPKSKKQKYYCG